MSVQTNPKGALAVLDAAVAQLGCAAAVDLTEARAAFAELIEADKEYDAAKHAHACIAHETYKVGEWFDHDERLRAASQRLLLAGERRRAALARVGGGK